MPSTVYQIVSIFKNVCAHTLYTYFMDSKFLRQNEEFMKETSLASSDLKWVENGIKKGYD